MKSKAILYVPSDTPEAMTMATHKVAGVPLIIRGIMTLAEAGINRCTLLIAASQRPKIERFLGRYKERRLPAIDVIVYDEPYRVSPNIVREIGETIDDSCLIINANLIFEKKLAMLVLNTPPDENGAVICQEGVHQIPIMHVRRQAWLRLYDFAAEPRSIQSCLIHLKGASPNRVVQKPPEINSHLVMRHRDRAVAEKFLAEAIRHAVDGPIARHINKRISLPISLFLSKLWISPHAITAVNIVIGIFSGVFVADGHRYDVILFGAALFQLASIVDGCDGEVAKLTFRCSKFGQYIDSISDNLTLGSLMTGMVAGYWRQTHSPVAFAVGGIMIACTIATLFWMALYLKKNTQSASLVTFDRQYLQHLTNQPRWLMTFIKYGKYTLKKDVFSFAVLCFAAAGVLYWWIYFTTLGAALAAIILTYLNAQNYLAGLGRPRVAGIRIDHEEQPV